jgi:hypothetical protein
MFAFLMDGYIAWLIREAFFINIDSLYKHMFPVRLRSCLIHLTLYGSIVDHSKVDRCVQRTFCEPSKIHQLPTKIHMNYMNSMNFAG